MKTKKEDASLRIPQLSERSGWISAGGNVRARAGTYGISLVLGLAAGMLTLTWPAHAQVPIAPIVDAEECEDGADADLLNADLYTIQSTTGAPRPRRRDGVTNTEDGADADPDLLDIRGRIPTGPGHDEGDNGNRGDRGDNGDGDASKKDASKKDASKKKDRRDKHRKGKHGKYDKHHGGHHHGKGHHHKGHRGNSHHGKHHGDASADIEVDLTAPRILLAQFTNDPAGGDAEGAAADPDQAKIVDLINCYAILAVNAIGKNANEGLNALAPSIASGNRDIQRLAMDDLGRISASLVGATPVLIQGLASPDARVRQTAYEALIEANTYARRLVPVLEDVLLAGIEGDGDGNLAQTAARSLGELGAYGAPAVWLFDKAVESPNLGIRFYSADGLIKIDRQMRSARAAFAKVEIPEVRAVAEEEFGAEFGEDRADLLRVAARTLRTIGTAAKERVRRHAAGDAGRGIDDLRDASVFSTSATARLLDVLAKSTSTGATFAGFDDALRSGIEESVVAAGSSELLSALASSEPGLRTDALKALFQTNENVVDVIKRGESIRDPDYRQRLDLMFSDIKRYIASFRTDLVGALDDDDLRVREAAIRALGALGVYAEANSDELIQAKLMQSLRSDDPSLRSTTALAFGKLGRESDATTPILIDVLDDREPLVRYRAAKGLRFLGPSAYRAVDVLKGLFQDGDLASSYQAARALAAIDPKIEAGRIVKVLDVAHQAVPDLALKMDELDAASRRVAERRLENMGPAALAALSRVTPKLAATSSSDNAAFVRHLKAIAAEARGEASLINHVLLAGNPENRKLAATILGAIGAEAKTAVVELAGLIDNPALAPETRCAIVAAIGDINIYTAETTRILLVKAGYEGDKLVKDVIGEALRTQAS